VHGVLPSPQGNQPVADSWLIGKARGELPWFGLLKLWATGSAPDYAPQNSRNNLVICLALIVIIPICVDLIVSGMKRNGVSLFKRKREREDVLYESEDEDVIELSPEARLAMEEWKAKQADKQADNRSAKVVRAYKTTEMGNQDLEEPREKRRWERDR